MIQPTLLGQVFGVGVIRQRAHGRQTHKALAQALHATAFLVDRQQQVRAHGTNRRAQFPHLARMLDIACKNDQASPTSGWRNRWRSSAVSQLYRQRRPSKNLAGQQS